MGTAVIVVEAAVPLTSQANHHGWEPGVLAVGYELALFDGLNCPYEHRRAYLDGAGVQRAGEGVAVEQRVMVGGWTVRGPHTQHVSERALVLDGRVVALRSSEPFKDGPPGAARVGAGCRGAAGPGCRSRCGDVPGSGWSVAVRGRSAGV